VNCSHLGYRNMKWLIAGNFSLALISILISAFILRELEVSDFGAVERRIITQENELKDLSVSQQNLKKVLKDKGLLLEEIEAQQNTLYRDVNDRKEVIDEEIASLKKRIKNDSEANALIEIEQLIRSANQRSLFERDFAAALLIMKAVSSRLEENSSTISDFDLIKEAIDKDIELLKKEVIEAKRICLKNKWVTIDVTKKSIEEIAATVLEYYKIYRRKNYDKQ